MTCEVEAFHDARTGTISYLLIEPTTRVAAVIDPVLGFDAAAGRTDDAPLRPIERRLDERRLHLVWLLETHIHADHLSGSAELQARRGGKSVIGTGIVEVWRHWYRLFPDGCLPATTEAFAAAQFFDRLVQEGDRLPLGAAAVEVIGTPGHTPADLSYRVDDAVFVGDTLFMPDAGTARCDFPGGNAATMYRSIRRLLALPPATRLYTCHDYGHEHGKAPHWQSTVEEQRAHNIHVGGAVTESDYVALRTGRDRTLSPPALLWPALQVNLRGGRLPVPDAQGRSWLALPVNASMHDAAKPKDLDA